MEYPLKQGHWNIARKGSMVFPREVQTCFLGHFTAWVESDLVLMKNCYGWILTAGVATLKNVKGQ